MIPVLVIPIGKDSFSSVPLHGHNYGNNKNTIEKTNNTFQNSPLPFMDNGKFQALNGQYSNLNNENFGIPTINYENKKDYKSKFFPIYIPQRFIEENLQLVVEYRGKFKNKKDEITKIIYEKIRNCRSRFLPFVFKGSEYAKVVNKVFEERLYYLNIELERINIESIERSFFQKLQEHLLLGKDNFSFNKVNSDNIFNNYFRLITNEGPKIQNNLCLQDNKIFERIKTLFKNKFEWKREETIHIAFSRIEKGKEVFFKKYSRVLNYQKKYLDQLANKKIKDTKNEIERIMDDKFYSFCEKLIENMKKYKFCEIDYWFNFYFGGLLRENEKIKNSLDFEKELTDWLRCCINFSTLLPVKQTA
jgi:hypothetical protein